MDHDRLLDSLDRLGHFFGIIAESDMNDLSGHDFPPSYFELMQKAVKKAENENPWFTEVNILFALKAWSLALKKEKITEWTTRYRGMIPVYSSRTVGLVMAGNIPLVGFHDYISALVSGHKVITKLSRDDSALITTIHGILSDMMPEIGNRVTFTQEPIKGFDAVIATGSNNTSRYFEYYFGKYPHIIRRNRNGVAVLGGDESEEEMKGLADDMFLYFGLGCRNVSKIYLPSGYDPQNLFRYFDDARHVAEHSKYMNNYDYQKAVLIVNQLPFHDNGFVILRENTQVSSPVATVHIEYYSRMDELVTHLEIEKENIQCIVSNLQVPGDVVPPGHSQLPELWDYSDGVDTIRFLAGI